MIRKFWIDIGTCKHFGDALYLGDNPLTEEITRMWLSLPLDLRTRPVLILELIPQLRGRFNLRPSAGDVGQALRSLNFTPVRDWRSGRRR